MARGPLCIIPARGGSKRFPRKNLALLGGKPLLAYVIEAARGSGVFERVCVSSEDPEILETARRWGAEPIVRPAELAADAAQVKQVCAHLLESFAREGLRYDEFGVGLVTNPLVAPEDLRGAYAAFKQAGADTLMSLVPFSHPPQRAVAIIGGRVRPFFGIQQMKPAQQLEPLYRHDGAIIFAKTDAFLRDREFYGDSVAPYFMPVERSVDIDSPADLLWAEFLLGQQSRVSE
jgi:N-acylneuraminate cytidylyltransferase